jgi:hypothetical protein
LQAFSNILMRGLIGNLRIRCKNNAHKHEEPLLLNKGKLSPENGGSCQWVGKLNDWPSHEKEDCSTYKAKKLQKSCKAMVKREVSKAHSHMEASTANATKKMRKSLDSLMKTEMAKFQSQLAEYSGAFLDIGAGKMKEFIDAEVSKMQTQLVKHSDARLDITRMKKAKDCVDTTLIAEASMIQITFDAVLDEEIQKVHKVLARKLYQMFDDGLTNYNLEFLCIASASYR